MVDTGFHAEGTDALGQALDRLAQRVHSATRKAVREATRHAQRRATVHLSRYYHPPNTPTPSPPGQPPARIGGHLRGSLKPTGPFPTAGGYTGQLGATAVYARIQELGGRTGRNHASELPPRPYLRPTHRAMLADGSLRRIFADAWRDAL